MPADSYQVIHPDAFYEALKAGDHQAVRDFLARGENPDRLYDVKGDPDYTGSARVATPLLIAFYYHKGTTRDQLIRILLDNGADAYLFPFWGTAREKDLTGMASQFDDSQHCFSQNWLSTFLSAFGYDVNPGGVCNGLVNMAEQDVHFGRGADFNELLVELYEVYLEARKRAIEELGTSSPTDNKELFNETLRQLILDVIEEHDNELSLRAFCDGLAAFQDQSSSKLAHLHKSPEELKQKKSYDNISDLRKVQKIISPDLPPERQLSWCDQLTGAYSLTELETYFRCLQEEIDQSHLEGPVSFKLAIAPGESDVGHTAYFSYHPQRRCWFFMDAATLPMQTLPVDDEETFKKLALKTAKALSRDAGMTPVMNTRIYTGQRDQAKMKACLASLDNNPQWTAIHQVTPKKLQLKDKDGDSRLYWLAAVMHDTKTLKAIPLTKRGLPGHILLTAVTGSLYLFYLLGVFIHKQIVIKQAAAEIQRALVASNQADTKPIAATGTDKIPSLREKAKSLERETKGKPVVLPQKDPLLSQGITQTAGWVVKTGKRKQPPRLETEKLLKKRSSRSNRAS